MSVQIDAWIESSPGIRSLLANRGVDFGASKKRRSSEKLRMRIRTLSGGPVFHETPGIGATILSVKAIQSPKYHRGFLNCPSVHLGHVGPSLRRGQLGARLQQLMAAAAAARP
jgi:hypothetical protein